MTIFNQFSAVLMISTVLLTVLVGLRLRRVSGLNSLMILVVAGGIMIGIWSAIRPSSSDVDSVASAEQLIGNGKPTLLEFFSQY